MSPARSEAQIVIVDDDAAIRESLQLLLYSEGYHSLCYESADDFLQRADYLTIDCLLLDIRMPGTDGLQLFHHLRGQQVPFPIIFITGHGDIPLAVTAIKQGAFNFLSKPFQPGELLKVVGQALDHGLQNRQRARERFAQQQRLDSLTPREREVLDALVQGLSNKGIAELLEISPRTVEIHRAKVMEKMAAGSLPELARLMEQLHTP